MGTNTPTQRHDGDANELGGAREEGGGGVQDGAALPSHDVREDEHADSRELPEQQEAPGAGEGLRQTLQHGPGGREGDVDGDSENGEGQDGVEANQKGEVHQQNVSQGRLRDSRPSESKLAGGSPPPGKSKVKG